MRQLHLKYIRFHDNSNDWNPVKCLSSLLCDGGTQWLFLHSVSHIQCYAVFAVRLSTTAIEGKKDSRLEQCLLFKIDHYVTTASCV